MFSSFSFPGKLFLPPEGRIRARKEGAYNIDEGTVAEKALSPSSDVNQHNGSVTSSDEGDDSGSESSSDSEPPSPGAGNIDRVQIKGNPLAMDDD